MEAGEGRECRQGKGRAANVRARQGAQSARVKGVRRASGTKHGVGCQRKVSTTKLSVGSPWCSVDPGILGDPSSTLQEVGDR